jgi:plasmid stabilization system protein ParE
MSYSVVVFPAAATEAADAFHWIQQRSPDRAERWLAGLEAAIQSLAEFPERCPRAPENAYFAQEMRQLLYGKGAGAYRILFTIRGENVNVLHIRHGARKALWPEEGEDDYSALS